MLINGREMVDAQKWYQAIGSQSGLPQYYLYSATNVRLQELSLGYTLPAKWFRDKDASDRVVRGAQPVDGLLQSAVRPRSRRFDVGLNYQGIDYFMMPLDAQPRFQCQIPILKR